MSATVLPELAAESVELAERLVRLSSEEGLNPAEAEYILACGLAAIQRVSRLWPIIRGRIAAGMTAATARTHLGRLREAVDKNLVLAGVLKKLAQAITESKGREPEAGPGLDAAEDRLLEVRAEAARLLAVVDAPARWPDEEQLREAKEAMQHGERLTADEVRVNGADETPSPHEDTRRANRCMLEALTAIGSLRKEMNPKPDRADYLREAREGAMVGLADED